MIVVSAELRTVPGKREVLERAFAVLAEGVAADEPGTLVFSLSRDPEDEDLHIAFEIYASPEARALHHESEHLQVARKTLAGVLDGPSKIVIRETSTVFGRPIPLGSA